MYGGESRKSVQIPPAQSDYIDFKRNVRTSNEQTRYKLKID
jgi:hypothetical protein